MFLPVCPVVHVFLVLPLPCVAAVSPRAVSVPCAVCCVQRVGSSGVLVSVPLCVRAVLCFFFCAHAVMPLKIVVQWATSLLAGSAVAQFTAVSCTLGMK